MTGLAAAAATDVSVLIVTQNAAADAARCLDALLPDVAGPLGVELLVLDNASDDATPRLIRDQYPQVRLIEQRFRAGFGANNNTLMRAAGGRYLYLLNADAVSQPGSLAVLCAYMDAHPGVAALAPAGIHPDGRHHPSAYRFPGPLTSLIGLATLGQAGIEQSRGTNPRRVDWAQACALVLRRSAIDRVGGFDEEFFMYAEETDLQRRFRHAGFETHWLPSVTVTHARAAASGALPDPRLNEEWRSRHLYWHKHYGRLASHVCALAAAAQYALMSVAASVAGRNDPRRLRAASRNALRVSGPGLRELAAAHNPERAG